jgi:hypothetical protein
MGTCSRRCSFSATRVFSRLLRAAEAKMNACIAIGGRQQGQRCSQRKHLGLRRREHFREVSESPTFRLTLSTLKPRFFASAFFRLSVVATVLTRAIGQVRNWLAATRLLWGPLSIFGVP